MRSGAAGCCRTGRGRARQRPTSGCTPPSPADTSRGAMSEPDGVWQTPKGTSRSDALVFFGATGDLAYKKIFPALQSMVETGILGCPVIGVAKAGWTLEQLKARAKESIEKHGTG